jgi:hypothetical protein
MAAGLTAYDRRASGGLGSSGGLASRRRRRSGDREHVSEEHERTEERWSR